MGGRVYDPKLGRFLSPDPNIPDPSNSQAFNRYAYVYNNPLSYTDPSGFIPQQKHPGMGNQSRSWQGWTGGGIDEMGSNGSFAIGYGSSGHLVARAKMAEFACLSEPSTWVQGVPPQAQSGDQGGGVSELGITPEERAAISKATRELFDDVLGNNNIGPKKSVADGKFQLANYDSDEPVSNQTASVFEEALKDVFNNGGRDGSDLKNAGNAQGKSLLVVFNNKGVNAAGTNRGDMLALDLSTPRYFYDLNSGSVKPFSLQRVLAHELSHQWLGLSDNPRLTENAVKFADRVMKSIYGQAATMRYLPQNFCISTDDCRDPL